MDAGQSRDNPAHNFCLWLQSFCYLSLAKWICYLELPKVAQFLSRSSFQGSVYAVFFSTVAAAPLKVQQTSNIDRSAVPQTSFPPAQHTHLITFSHSVCGWCPEWLRKHQRLRQTHWMYSEMSGPTALTQHWTQRDNQLGTYHDFPLQSLRHTNQWFLKNNSLSIKTS